MEELGRRSAKIVQPLLVGAAPFHRERYRLARAGWLVQYHVVGLLRGRSGLLLGVMIFLQCLGQSEIGPRLGKLPLAMESPAVGADGLREP